MRVSKGDKVQVIEASDRLNLEWSVNEFLASHDVWNAEFLTPESDGVLGYVAFITYREPEQKMEES